jgi:hypothetical protein
LSVTPPEGSAIQGAIATDITIVFNKAINPATLSNFNLITTEAWLINLVTMSDSMTAIVQVYITSSTPFDGFILELVNITDTTGGSLQGQTSFNYSPG